MSPTSSPTRWDALKQRLQQSTLATEAASFRDQQRRNEIYRQRAFRLATPVGQDDFSRNTTRTIVFVLGDQSFGIPLNNVGQVYPARPLTPVPRAPSWVLGIANFDARIRSVIDLAELLNIPNDRATGRNVLLVHCLDRTVAVQVDRVDEVQSIDLGRLSALDQQSDMGRTQIVRGVTPEYLVILSADALITYTKS